MSISRIRPAPILFLILLSALIVVMWWLPNRPQLGDLPMPVDKFNSVSFTPYRDNESPLTGHFPTRAEVDQDLAMIATRSRGIRTYAAIEGDYDLPAMARAHGLKMWQGIWLGGDRATNVAEIARGIALANKYPDVIERVVVGNEVLLRKDLPADELIADIDHVRHAIHQPVTYADFWNFFADNPQLAAHLDVLTIHILPYWEDHPADIDGAMARAAEEVGRMQTLFPGRHIAVGETGWPSRGRWRQDAAPSVVNQATFLRRFIALAQQKGLEYNLFSGTDEVWKYHNEGVVGASWGLWTTDRQAKFPLQGPVQEDTAWPVPAGLSIVCGWLLFLMVTAGRVLPAGRQMTLAFVAMALGGALGFGWAGTAPVLYSRFVIVAGIGNLVGQAALAFLFMHLLARRYETGRGRVSRTGRDATLAARALLQLRCPTGWQGPLWHEAVFDDLAFLFVWTAAVLQLLLLYDPRYRDFPLPTFAVPVMVVLVRLFLLGLPLGGGAREEWVAGAALAIGAIGSAIQEGPINLQSWEWNACALLMAVPPLLRVARRGRARQTVRLG